MADRGTEGAARGRRAIGRPAGAVGAVGAVGAAGAAIVAALALAVAALGPVPAAAQTAQPAAPWLSEAQLADSAQVQAIDALWAQAGPVATLVGQGDLRLAWLRWLQPDRAAERGAIVLVSGRTEFLAKYKELVFDLWRQGWSVYLHDHRGQGRSAREPAVADTPEKGHVGRFDDYVADLRQFLRAQVAPAGHRNVFLLAHSMGGAIAARLLESGNLGVPALQAAALSSPMLRIRGLGGLPADWLSCPLAHSMRAFGADTRWVPGGGGYEDKGFPDNPYTGSPVRYQRVQAELAREAQLRLGSPTVGWVAEACDAAAAARADAGRVATPTLVVLAGGDRIVHPDGAQAFCAVLKTAARPEVAAGCGGPDGGPLVVPGAEHELFIERDAMRTQALQAVLQHFERFRRP